MIIDSYERMDCIETESENIKSPCDSFERDSTKHDGLTGKGLVNHIDDKCIIEFDSLLDLRMYDRLCSNMGYICHGAFEDLEKPFLGFSCNEIQESSSHLRKFRRYRNSRFNPVVRLKRLPQLCIDGESSVLPSPLNPSSIKPKSLETVNGHQCGTSAKGSLRLSESESGYSSSHSDGSNSGCKVSVRNCDQDCRLNGFDITKLRIKHESTSDVVSQSDQSGKSNAQHIRWRVTKDMEECGDNVVNRDEGDMKPQCSKTASKNDCGMIGLETMDDSKSGATGVSQFDADQFNAIRVKDEPSASSSYKMTSPIPYLLKCGFQNAARKCKDLNPCAKANKKFQMFFVLTVGRGRTLPQKVVESLITPPDEDPCIINKACAYMAASAADPFPTTILVPAVQEVVEKALPKAQSSWIMDSVRKTQEHERKKWLENSSSIHVSIAQDEQAVIAQKTIAAKQKKFVMSRKFSIIAKDLQKGFLYFEKNGIKAPSGHSLTKCSPGYSGNYGKGDNRCEPQNKRLKSDGGNSETVPRITTAVSLLEGFSSDKKVQPSQSQPTVGPFKIRCTIDELNALLQEESNTTGKDKLELSPKEPFASQEKLKGSGSDDFAESTSSQVESPTSTLGTSVPEIPTVVFPNDWIKTDEDEMAMKKPSIVSLKDIEEAGLCEDPDKVAKQEETKVALNRKSIPVFVHPRYLQKLKRVTSDDHSLENVDHIQESPIQQTKPNQQISNQSSSSDESSSNLSSEESDKNLGNQILVEEHHNDESPDVILVPNETVSIDLTEGDGDVIDLTDEERRNRDKTTELLNTSDEMNFGKPIPQWGVICTSLPELGFVEVQKTAEKLVLYDKAIVSHPLEFDNIQELKRFLNSRLANLTYPYRSKIALDWIVVTAGFLRVKTVPPTNHQFWMDPKSAKQTQIEMRHFARTSKIPQTKKAIIVPTFLPRSVPINMDQNPHGGVKRAVPVLQLSSLHSPSSTRPVNYKLIFDKGKSTSFPSDQGLVIDLPPLTSKSNDRGLLQSSAALIQMTSSPTSDNLDNTSAALGQSSAPSRPNMTTSVVSSSKAFKTPLLLSPARQVLTTNGSASLNMAVSSSVPVPLKTFLITSVPGLTPIKPKLSSPGSDPAPAKSGLLPSGSIATPVKTILLPISSASGSFPQNTTTSNPATPVVVSSSQSSVQASSSYPITASSLSPSKLLAQSSIVQRLSATIGPSGSARPSTSLRQPILILPKGIKPPVSVNPSTTHPSAKNIILTPFVQAAKKD